MSAQFDLLALQALAREEGIDDIGVTDTSPFPELIPWLESYASRGRTGFEAEDIQARINPLLWMDTAVSIVVIALPYLTEEGARTARSHPSGRTYGLTSHYTYGIDYHRVLADKLRALHRRMEAAVGRDIDMKLSVDTSPLVDRRIAERAGLGWIGKNAMFYSHKHGSYVFLGAMLVDLAIPPITANPPSVGALCGTCKRCLQACPTGAILAPGVIDATRCLSYVTQMKGVIPLEFRDKLGRRVWGCDVCQSTCPFNRDVEPSHVDAFGPSDELAYPDLVELLHMSNRQFMRKFGHTAMAWRGLRTLQRNALIALGNTGVRGAVPELVPFLASERTELRSSAAWALGKLGGPEASQALSTALDAEADDVVREELRNALEACHEHD
ncbi:tRNA epoxyqueuosine(34) reductase QueG [Alicyclobacillus fastidiosus]|uniref:tRNA epoxyqueuosine(34) reductase QueG n=1 Tax=Alicyclobacillus fastidiosus TaxID=392011 RepID=A0ABY6ZF94_9BACL|nr:tRNA epoxyqueuosine(34) reductase QueG [Alicyclobacillus fastidiosus]WAH41573.1 tRNA epoxyqueuosine(34) reductase QueG [Alicyclobacillus fastidiosus]GMA63232.1 epoxyqueuosine reductase [Alicyclobacillus fastidiosus]